MTDSRFFCTNRCEGLVKIGPILVVYIPFHRYYCTIYTLPCASYHVTSHMSRVQSRKCPGPRVYLCMDIFLKMLFIQKKRQHDDALPLETEGGRTVLSSGKNYLVDIDFAG